MRFLENQWHIIFHFLLFLNQVTWQDDQWYLWGEFQVRQIYHGWGILFHLITHLERNEDCCEVLLIVCFFLSIACHPSIHPSIPYLCLPAKYKALCSEIKHSEITTSYISKWNFILKKRGWHNLLTEFGCIAKYCICLLGEKFYTRYLPFFLNVPC